MLLFSICCICSSFLICLSLLSFSDFSSFNKKQHFLWFHFLPSQHRNYTSLKNVSDSARIYNIHLQVIEVHFQIPLEEFTGSAKYLRKEYPQFLPLSLITRCHSFHSFIHKLWSPNTIHSCYYYFEQSSIRSIKNKKNKRFYFISIYFFSKDSVDVSFWPISCSFSLKNFFLNISCEASLLATNSLNLCLSFKSLFPSCRIILLVIFLSPP